MEAQNGPILVNPASADFLTLKFKPDGSFNCLIIADEKRLSALRKGRFKDTTNALWPFHSYSF
jgi:hypothetical protein